MSEYNEYVTAVNKIFDYIAKMKAGWNNQDNFSYIEGIEEYKQVVTNSVKLFKEPQPHPQPPVKQQNQEELEALGND